MHRRLSLRTRFALSMALAFGGLCLFLVLFINLGLALFPGLRLPWASLVGLAVAVSGGGGSAYWLASVALRPVRSMQGAIQGIQPSTLHTRLKMTGPRDELRVLAESFDALLDRLEAAFVQQTQFVADAAHELRTPLATLRINLEVVADDPEATLTDYHQTIVTCERALTRLDQLVHQLLLLATAEHLGPTTSVDLAGLARQEVDAILPVAAAHAVTVARDVCTEAWVLGNAALLGIVLRNLLDNAVRYNHAGGSVTLALHTTPTTAVLTVIDTGSGIPPGEEVAIFRRFYRLDPSRARASGGFGLGLALAHHIVTQHGGTIQVQSTVGQGSCFTVALPRGRPPEAT